MRTPEEIADLIRLTIVEEIQVNNLISQGEPENWVPKYIENLTNRLTELVLDEVAFKRKY